MNTNNPIFPWYNNYRLKQTYIVVVQERRKAQLRHINPNITIYMLFTRSRPGKHEPEADVPRTSKLQPTTNNMSPDELLKY